MEMTLWLQSTIDVDMDLVMTHVELLYIVEKLVKLVTKIILDNS